MTPAELISAYLADFAAAKPEHCQPVIEYRKGWFCFWSEHHVYITQRYRRAEIERMRKRLQDRAKEQAQ